MFKYTFTFILLLSTKIAFSEAWLSNRFAQNCAGCHAPARKNLKPIKRRCTLSCQGCHENPNGGGLRNNYGKWTENKWLRSFRTDKLKNDKNFVPENKQMYGKNYIKKKKSYKNNRVLLVETNKHPMNEEQFERDGNEHIIVSKKEFMKRIPESDPFTQRATSKLSAGGDIRWQYFKYKNQTDSDSTSTSNTKEQYFLMAADFGVVWRPFYRMLKFVQESRMTGVPTKNNKFKENLSRIKTRSFYAMVDELPWNIFVMSGYYKPLFGNEVADHEALAAKMTTRAITGNKDSNYDLLLQATSVGTAPNVPYANIHLIHGIQDDVDKNTTGFALNAGLRFVTLGGVIDYSYWDTSDHRDLSGNKSSTQMHSAHIAGKLSRLIASYEFINIKRKTEGVELNSGNVHTLDLQTQIWRENYLTFNYAQANTTVDLRPGSTKQYKIGVRAFILQGFDVSLSFDNTESKVFDTKDLSKTTVASKLSGLSGQFHLYF